MGKREADRIEEALLRYTAERVDLDRLRPLIEQSLQRQPDDRANAMLRRGAQFHVRPLGDGLAELVLSYSDAAEFLAVHRAEAFQGEAEDPPAVGSAERDEVLVLTRFPRRALASLPRG